MQLLLQIFVDVPICKHHMSHITTFHMSENNISENTKKQQKKNNIPHIRAGRYGL